MILPGDPGYRCPRCGYAHHGGSDRRLDLVHTVEDWELVGLCEECVTDGEALLNQPQSAESFCQPRRLGH
jgi:hypothetical protein